MSTAARLLTAEDLLQLDLAGEVVSPSNRSTGVEEKGALWFHHGARMVVVINPRRRTVAAYRSPTQARLLASGDTLDGDEVVPGWLLPVAEIFEELTLLDDRLPKFIARGDPWACLLMHPDRTVLSS